MDVKGTSKARSRHVTASDERLSATSVGLAGMSVLVLFTGFIVGMDAVTFLSYVVSRIRRRWRRRKRKQLDDYGADKSVTQKREDMAAVPTDNNVQISTHAKAKQKKAIIITSV